MLGNNRDKTAPFITSTFDAPAQALIARNSHGIDYRGRAAFWLEEEVDRWLEQLL